MQEYISILEAMQITGLAEKTLRAKLRGKVTIFGKDSWDRNQFFAFWAQEHERKCQDRQRRAALRRIQIDNLLAKVKK
jgi:hypothetical protein